MIARSYLPSKPSPEPPSFALFPLYRVSLSPLSVLWTSFLFYLLLPYSPPQGLPQALPPSHIHASGNPGPDLRNSYCLMTLVFPVLCHFSSDVVISQDFSLFKCTCLRRMLRSGTSREIRVSAVPEARESRPVARECCLEELHIGAHNLLRSTDVVQTLPGSTNNSRKQDSPRDFAQKSFLASFPVTPLSSPTPP